MTSSLQYDPHKVSVVVQREVVKGFSDGSIGQTTIPLELTMELTGVGKVRGTVYLTQEQFEIFSKQHKES